MTKRYDVPYNCKIGAHSAPLVAFEPLARNPLANLFADMSFQGTSVNVGYNSRSARHLMVHAERNTPVKRNWPTLSLTVWLAKTGEAYGILIKEWRLFQRAAFVIDHHDRVVSAEYVADQMRELDYSAAIRPSARHSPHEQPVQYQS